MFIRFVLIVMVLFCAGQMTSFAQNDEDDIRKPQSKDEVPPWMEKVDRGGGSTYLIPKGARVDEVTSGVVKIEPPAEFVARRLYEQDIRLKKIEKSQETVTQELEGLKKELQQLREQRPILQETSNGAASYNGLKD